MKGVLSGSKVLYCSTLFPGPMATLILAEVDAEVIKVERPGRGEGFARGDIRESKPTTCSLRTSLPPAFSGRTISAIVAPDFSNLAA